jgi:diguanylate cyclase (GGDEF)-like protein
VTTTQTPRGRSLSSGARVGLLTLALAGMTVLLYAGALAGRPAPYLGLHLRWWVLGPLVYATEMSLVHLQFRRDNHSFSLGELALVLGLMFSPSWELLVGQLLGTTLAFGVHRRLSPQKLAFNMALSSLNAMMAAVVFHAIVPHFTVLGPRVWAAAFVAIMTSTAIGGVMVVAAISLSEGRLQPNRLRTVLTLASLGAGTNVSLALIAGTLLVFAPLSTCLLAVPVATVFVSYRAYLREREKHESLEFLYASTRILHDAPELEQAVVALVAQARDMFRAEMAELLFVLDDGQDVLRTRVSEDGGVQTMAPVDEPAVHALWRRLSERQESMLLSHPTGDEELDAFLVANGLRDAMIAALRGEERAFGLAIVGNRIGGVTFDLEDARLFETLANHTSVALENGRLEQSLTQLRELEKRLKHLAFHDPLTGLGNRSLFQQHVESSIAEKKACAVLFIDLDDFKTVNDTLGHAAGDQLLIAVSDRITACLRPNDHAARLGGDEFAVLLDGITDVNEAQLVASRITEALRMPVPLGGQDVRVGASIGIAPARADLTSDELLRNADLAMYTAKSQGKGSFQLFQPAMNAEVAARHRLKGDLAAAVERGEFTVYYQPIVDLGSGRPVGFEALVRWQHPDLGLLLPDTFIPMAEETGLIDALGRMVLIEALAQTARWERHGLPEDLWVSVNLSPLQVHLPGAVAQVADALADSGVAPCRLVLEITENLMLRDADAAVETLHALRRLGVRLALDDFGTGYSSLGQLRDLPVDIVKIAKPFIDSLDGRFENSAFAAAILALADNLRLTTLAEGIEDAQQMSELRRLGCRLGQGFHLGRPMPAAAVDVFLARYDESLGAAVPPSRGSSAEATRVIVDR